MNFPVAQYYRNRVMSPYLTILSPFLNTAIILNVNTPGFILSPFILPSQDIVGSFGRICSAPKTRLPQRSKIEKDEISCTSSPTLIDSTSLTPSPFGEKILGI